MNDDLHTSFDRAVDSALDQAGSPEEMRRAVAEKVRARRRHRPAYILGATLGSLALVGGTAFAAVQLSGEDERPRFPDVIGSPRPERPAATTSPTEAPTTEPAPDPVATPVATLPAPDANAVFPECGALVNPPAGHLDLSLGGWFADGPLGTSFTPQVWSSGTADLKGELSTHVTLVAVKDGVVVGSTSGTGAATSIPFTLGASDGPVTGGTGDLAHTLCTDDTSPLPAGRYSVWASTEYTITERTPYDENYVALPTVTTRESGAMLDEVAALWMGAEGVSVAHPGLAPGWPQNLDEETAFSGAQTTPETVVWIQVSERDAFTGEDPTLIPARDHLADLGYLGGEIPFQCQGEAPAELGLGDDPALVDRYGIGVVFATRSEAETFVSLWEPLHGPVAGLVTQSVTCHFS